MTIGAILSRKGKDVATLPAEATVADAVALLTSHRIGALPVMTGDEVAGVFSERDVIHCLQANGSDALQKRVFDVMTTPAVTVTSHETVIGALALMTRRRIRHLPVVENGRLMGLVSIGDLVKYRIDLIEADAESLRTYIQSA